MAKTQNKYGPNDPRPVQVLWGAIWVNTEGVPSTTRIKGMKAKVYDPHAKEWVWVDFAQSDWNASHSDKAWAKTPQGDYLRPGFIMVRQSDHPLRYALHRTYDGNNLTSDRLCLGDCEECDKVANAS